MNAEYYLINYRDKCFSTYPDYYFLEKEMKRLFKKGYESYELKIIYGQNKPFTFKRIVEITP